jgi:hypothetical protein
MFNKNPTKLQYHIIILVCDGYVWYRMVQLDLVFYGIVCCNKVRNQVWLDLKFYGMLQLGTIPLVICKLLYSIPMVRYGTVLHGMVGTVRYMVL